MRSWNMSSFVRWCANVSHFYHLLVKAMCTGLWLYHTPPPPPPGSPLPPTLTQMILKLYTQLLFDYIIHVDTWLPFKPSKTYTSRQKYSNNSTAWWCAMGPSIINRYTNEFINTMKRWVKGYVISCMYIIIKCEMKYWFIVHKYKYITLIE